MAEIRNNYYRVLKHLLFIVILLILILPSIQFVAKPVKLKPLLGSFNKEPLQLGDINWKQWINGTYQTKINNRLEHYIGFRPFLVRLNNQIDYSLFTVANANNIKIGKDRYLLGYSYTNTHLGIDFTGKAYIADQVWKLKYLQDTLNTLNKLLVVVLAPGKASFYKQYIPDNDLKMKREITNYDAFSNLLVSRKLNFIDFKAYFDSLKNNSEYSLFPKCGIHWSTYGTAIAADSLLRYLACNSDYKIPALKWESFPVNDSMDYAGFDYDIGRGMNLLFKIKQPNMAYVEFDLELDTTVFVLPNVLVIGDSYYRNILETNIPSTYFNHHEFWYYNMEVIPNPANSSSKVKYLNLEEKIKTSDIIILLSTDANLYKFPFGFADDLFTLFQPDSAGYLYDYCLYMLSNYSDSTSKQLADQLLTNVHSKSVIDSCLKEIKHRMRNEKIEMYKNRIFYEPSLLNDVFRKAKVNNISVFDQIAGDADWLFQHENTK